MLTLTKKTWKYIFYAVIALVLLYVIFGSTRERFTSVNPLPTAADFAALKPAFDKVNKQFEGQQQVEGKVATAALKTLPESFKAMSRFVRANVVPLLPYKMVKASTKPDGSDVYDFYLLFFVEIYKDILILPLAYAVKQQSSPPTMTAFVDMMVKIFNDNAPQPINIDAPMQKLIDEIKKGETTFQFHTGDTMPNPGYWLYKYIYGDPKAAPSGPPAASSSSSSSKTSSGSIGGGGGGKCTPSLQQVPGGITETRCFN